MKKILLTVALNVTDRPSRWKHVSKAYLALATSLTKLGHECLLFVTPDAIHNNLKKSKYIVQTAVNFNEVIENFKPDICFIWGGRTEADHKTINQIKQHQPNCKFIYSEAAWFPQRGTIYFDERGTNAEASFCQRDFKDSVTQEEIRHFLKLRKKIIRKDRKLHWWNRIEDFNIQKPDLSKKILVPLQDENDTNIINSSPFKTMRELIFFLSETYPNYQFIIREHPRAKSKNLPTNLNNIEYQNSKKPLFEQFDDIGLVIGINSTVLLQSAIHNKPVIALGEGIVSNGKYIYKLNKKQPIKDLTSINIDSNEALIRLTYLLVKIQLPRKNLKKPSFIKKSYLKNLIY